MLNAPGSWMYTSVDIYNDSNELLFSGLAEIQYGSMWVDGGIYIKSRYMNLSLLGIKKHDSGIFIYNHNKAPIVRMLLICVFSSNGEKVTMKNVELAINYSLSLNMEGVSMPEFSGYLLFCDTTKLERTI